MGAALFSRRLRAEGMLAVQDLDAGHKSISRNVAVSYSIAAFAIAGVLLVWGPAAVDQAAHSHLEQIFNSRGFALWDNTWYLGRYSFVNYSFALYLVAYLLGLKLTAALSVAVSVWVIGTLADAYFPGAFARKRRLSLLVIPLMVLTGAWPFLLGVTFVLLSLSVYRTRKKALFGIFALLSLLSSPLAFLALALLVFSAEVPFGESSVKGRIEQFLKKVISSYYLWTVIFLAALQYLSIRAFPDHGHYPFSVTDLVIVEGFSLVCLLLVPKGRSYTTKVRILIALYGSANVVSFVIHSNLGSNSTRVVDFAFPIVVGLAGLRQLRPLPLKLALIVPALLWNLTPLSQIMSASIYRTSSPGFWKGLEPVIARYVVPGSRVELVDTSNHQGAYYLPRMGYPLVRGWFRQDDFPQNELLYQRSEMDSSTYLTWLENSGASVVVLPPGPLDFSSVAEASLLNSGRSGLTMVADVEGSKIFKVPGSPTVVRQPNGQFISARIGLQSLEFNAPVSGTYHLSLFYSPYFEINEGKVCEDSKGMVTLKIKNPGPHRLVFDLSPTSVVSVLFGHGGNSCS